MARFPSPRFRISSQQQLLLLKLYEDGPAPVATLAASIFAPGGGPQPTAAATRACAATARRSARRLAENGLVRLWKAPHPQPATSAGGNRSSVLWAEIANAERVRRLLIRAVMLAEP